MGIPHINCREKNVPTMGLLNDNIYSEKTYIANRESM